MGHSAVVATPPAGEGEKRGEEGGQEKQGEQYTNRLSQQHHDINSIICWIKYQKVPQIQNI